MRKVFLLIIIALVILLNNNCTKIECGESEFNVVYTFIDYTDTLNYREFQKNWEDDLAQINSVIFPFLPCNGGAIKIIPINHLGSNETHFFSYQPLPPTLNEFDIPVDFQVFKQKVRSSFENSAKPEPFELPYTQIFEPLCRELNALSNQKIIGKKIVIIYSDMLEKSSSADFYKGRINQKKIISQMQNDCQCELPMLDDVEIYVISHRLLETNEVIRNAVKFWEMTFEQKNVKKINFGSSLEIYSIKSLTSNINK